MKSKSEPPERPVDLPLGSPSCDAKSLVRPGGDDAQFPLQLVVLFHNGISSCSLQQMCDCLYRGTPFRAFG